jgi:hypothetical protein
VNLIHVHERRVSDAEEVLKNTNFGVHARSMITTAGDFRELLKQRKK